MSNSKYKKKAILVIFAVCISLILAFLYFTLTSVKDTTTAEENVNLQLIPIQIYYGKYMDKDYPNCCIYLEKNTITYVGTDDVESYDFFFPDTTNLTDEAIIIQKDITKNEVAEWKSPHNYILQALPSGTFIAYNYYFDNNGLFHMAAGSEVIDEKTFKFFGHDMKLVEE